MNDTPIATELSPNASTRQKIEFYHNKYRKYLPAALFICGFFFDAILLERIDHLFSLIQQAVYILIVMQLMKLKILEHSGAWAPGPRLAKYWHYSSEALSFFLGTLLNFYMLFYFVSSSIAVSAVFLIIVFGLLVVNEIPSREERGIQIKNALLAVSVFSFLFIITTIAFGFVGYIPFGISLALGVLLFYNFFKFFQKKNLQNFNVKKSVLMPPVAVAVVLLGMYVLKILPPIPLSIQYIGIYHSVEKERDPVTGEQKIKLLYNRPFWKFWQHGDQSFSARPGDKIFCFVRIFAPGTFKDRVFYHWLKKGRDGWQTQDRIPNDIFGGREEGFRGYASKSNYEPGDWRVQVETQDGHEIGRISFTIEADSEVGTSREFRVERH